MGCRPFLIVIVLISDTKISIYFEITKFCSNYFAKFGNIFGIVYKKKPVPRDIGEQGLTK